MNYRVPFFSTLSSTDYPDPQDSVARVLNSGRFILGDEVERFEREFAAYNGTDYCVAVANGTDALELALKACDIGTGDSVILSANTGFYGSAAVLLCGARPTYVDIDDGTLNMGVSSLERTVHSNTRAILVTHLYGRMAPIEEIVAFARKHDLIVIEDCAQAHGARIGSRRAGSFGQLSCFSFYPTKNLGTLGDAGAVICSDSHIEQRLRRLRQYGWARKYQVEDPLGRNSRMDEIHAAILRDRLPFLDRRNSRRRSIAREYSQALSNLPLKCTPLLGEEYVAHLFVVRTDEREKLRAHLDLLGIMTDVHYPIPDHLQRGYASGLANGALPITERACEQILSLPCHPDMSEEEVSLVIQSLHDYYQ